MKTPEFGFTAFSWKGEPIEDIDAWAKARGERMVYYIHRHKRINIFTGEIIVDETPGRMPESFWNVLHIPQDHEYIETPDSPPIVPNPAKS